MPAAVQPGPSHDLMEPAAASATPYTRPRTESYVPGRNVHLTSADILTAPSDPEDSDDLPSLNTIRLMKQGPCRVAAPMVKATILSRGPIKQRRHYYGNARSTLNHSRGFDTRIMGDWFYPADNPEHRLLRSPTLPADAWKQVCAVFFFEHCCESANHTPPGRRSSPPPPVPR